MKISWIFSIVWWAFELLFQGFNAFKGNCSTEIIPCSFFCFTGTYKHHLMDQVGPSKSFIFISTSKIYIFFITLYLFSHKISVGKHVQVNCRGEYGAWAAFLALLVRLFFFIPGGFCSYLCYSGIGTKSTLVLELQGRSVLHCYLRNLRRVQWYF